MAQNPERRRFVRIHFQGSVELSQREQSWPCDLVDISLKGALLLPKTACAPDPSLPVTLTLMLDENNAIIMTGRAAHNIAGQFGLYCEQIDVDSMAHLRKLIDLNTGDPTCAERELKLLGEPN